MHRMEPSISAPSSPYLMFNMSISWVYWPQDTPPDTWEYRHGSDYQSLLITTDKHWIISNKTDLFQMLSTNLGKSAGPKVSPWVAFLKHPGSDLNRILLRWF